MLRVDASVDSGVRRKCALSRREFSALLDNNLIVREPGMLSNYVLQMMGQQETAAPTLARDACRVRRFHSRHILKC